MFYFFKLFNDMKKNQNKLKKVMFLFSLTLGVIGFNSLFNETKAKVDDESSATKQVSGTECTDKYGNLTGYGNICIKGPGACKPNPCP
jgi:hypothetical protein